MGSSLQALLYAFAEKLPIVYTNARKPFRFDYLDPQVDLSCLKMNMQSSFLNTFKGRVEVGIPKHLLWERLIFLLNLHGQNPLSNMAATVRFDGEDQFTFADKYSKLIDIRFEECVYFGDDVGDEILKINLDSNNYVCYDWIAFNRGGKHEIDYIDTSDEFVGEIWFYSSDRIDGKTPVKDACSVSLLTQEQLSDFNYSETMARFKVVSEMEARGMKGKFNGYGPNGKAKYYKFRTSCIRRRVEYTPEALTLPTSRFRHPPRNQDDILKLLGRSSRGYGRILKYL